jgi:aerobic carbon-monoxide dehydrogenase large subunit
VGDGQGSDEIVEKGRRIAAALIEVAEQDVEFAHPRFVVKGTDRSMGLLKQLPPVLEMTSRPI